MNVRELQMALTAHGCAPGAIDGVWGPMTRAAVMEALTDGPDTKLVEVDYHAAAQRLLAEVAAVKAVAAVEAAGGGFDGGRPKLLFEPHRFSKATGGRFDRAHPDISYPRWDRSKYPASQAGRYAQLLKAVCLDVNAGFASASYGKFQILGENYQACGFATPFAFAVAHAYDEVQQLRAFERFICARGLVVHLRTRNWDAFARGYNGPAYRENRYAEKLAAAFAAAGGR